jgi:hypothetical protein
VLIVTVVVPDPATVAGENPQVTFAGKLVHTKLTVPLKLLIGVTVTVEVVCAPLEIVAFAGFNVRLKSAGVTALTVTVIPEETEPLKLALPP